MLRHLRLIPHLVALFVRTKMEYRGAFWLDRVAQIFSYGFMMASIWLLLERFGVLGTWTWPEMALLFGFQLLVYALGASVSFVQMREMEDTIRLGRLDTLLTKPMSPWVFIVFSAFNIEYLGHVLLAVPVLVWALLHVDIAWDAGTVLFFVAAMLSSAMGAAAIITMIGATALVWVQSNHLFAIYFSFWELARLPLDIFPGAIQWLLIAVIPLGYMAAVPVAVLLGKPVPILGDLAGPVTLLSGPLLVLLAMAVWRWAMTRYQGAGG
jgi:ABC-2 type transport system permease protein